MTECVTDGQAEADRSQFLILYVSICGVAREVYLKAFVEPRTTLYGYGNEDIMDTDWTATEQWHGDTGQEQRTEVEHVCRRRRVFKSVVGRTRTDRPQSSVSEITLDSSGEKLSSDADPNLDRQQ